MTIKIKIHNRLPKNPPGDDNPSTESVPIGEYEYAKIMNSLKYNLITDYIIINQTYLNNRFYV